jgi:AcrR family transcriptional regulator
VTTETEDRILDVAIDVLAADPDAGMGAIATAAGVVRRTVYGYFPSRSELMAALTRRAVGELLAVLDRTAGSESPPDEAWVEFIGQVWPLVHRYRVLIVLRRGEFGPDIHALLTPVDTALADLVRRGQGDGVFGGHLPADVLGQVAWSTLFTIADHDLAHHDLDAGQATRSTLLLLGVPEARVHDLLSGRAHR